jgi:hypothetical protein
MYQTNIGLLCCVGSVTDGLVCDRSLGGIAGSNPAGVTDFVYYE